MTSTLQAQDCGKNWILTRNYDENGNEIGTTKVFFDNNGKTTQKQVRNESTGQVLASQTLYDLEQRPVVNTLTAPINNSIFSYNNNFITSSGNPYSYLNFDGDPTNTTNPNNKLNLPDAVDNSQQGSLGWYYSNNNTLEPMVAVTGYPYSRSDFYHDGTGAVKRSAGVGEQLKMGIGHEATGNSFPVRNELNNYLAIRNQFFPSATVGGGPTSLSGQVLQSLSTDENGLAVLTITDLTGKLALMTGRADPSSSAWLPITNTLSLSNVAPGYAITLSISGNNISSLAINSVNNVTVSASIPGNPGCANCQVYSGVGNNYIFAGTSYNLVTITSSYPFTVTAANSLNTVYDQAEAQYIEPSGSAFQYFRLATPSPVTIAGGSYTLYDMIAEADVTSTFTSGNMLPAGYYKVVATAPAPSTAITNTVTVTYTNKYSDISYNYYNQLGQLIASIAPNGVQQLINNQNNLGQYTLSTLPFVTTYQYDLQGRLTATKSPDGGTSNFIYRQDGKIRFSQNAYQKNSSNAGTGNLERFSYTNYDSYGRPIESGEYAASTATFAGLAANTTVLEATDPAGGLSAVSGLTRLFYTQTYYDLPATNLTLAGYTQDAGFLKGAVSYTTNGNSTTWYNYDDHGRVTWTVKQLPGLTGYKTVDYTYNDQGNVTKVDYQKGTPNERFIHYYSYDADGRLINAQTSVDGVNMVQQANYYYYLHGPLKRVELGNQLQGIDYVYTPQGWLKAINSPTGNPANDPMKDGVSNSFAPDAFGMQLEYFPGDYTRAGSNITNVNTGQQTYYNGNINGMSWQSNKPVSVISAYGTAVQNPDMYTFSYDPKYQYTGALWGTPNFANSTFGISSNNMLQEKVGSYDANGNILALQHTDPIGNPKHNFTYNYAAGTNQLTSVANAVTSNNYGTYTYDEIGRLKSQVNTAGTTYLKYDVTGKITGVYADAGFTQLKIGYSYDEAGNRIGSTNNTGSQPIITYYVYDATGNVLAIYTQTGTTATPALTEVPVYGSNRLGTYYTTGTFYIYELRDNVGSVRATITGTKNGNGQASVYGYNDYYPFGGIAQNNIVNYRYDYQGAYAEKDPVTGYNNFDLRMYDSNIGRWMGIDPKGEYNTPYEGMGNDPINNSDPDGGSVLDWVKDNILGTYTFDASINASNFANSWYAKNNFSYAGTSVLNFNYLGIGASFFGGNNGFYDIYSSNHTLLDEGWQHGPLKEVVIHGNASSSANGVTFAGLNNLYKSGDFGDPRNKPHPHIHAGIDLVNKTPGAIKGKYITNVVAGNVVKLVTKPDGQYAGVRVRIQDSRGYQYGYYHMISGSNARLQLGEHVSIGDTLGQVGDTGDSPGAYHLHFEVHGPIYKNLISPYQVFPVLNNLKHQ